MFLFRALPLPVPFRALTLPVFPLFPPSPTAYRQTMVTAVRDMYLREAAAPRFRAINVEAIEVDHPLSTSGAVLCNAQGEVQALWLSFSYQVRVPLTSTPRRWNAPASHVYGPGCGHRRPRARMPSAGRARTFASSGPCWRPSNVTRCRSCGPWRSSAGRSRSPSRAGQCGSTKTMGGRVYEDDGRAGKRSGMARPGGGRRAGARGGGRVRAAESASPGHAGQSLPLRP